MSTNAPSDPAPKDKPETIKISTSKEAEIIRQQLGGSLPTPLIDQALLAYDKLRQYYFLGRYRPACLEAAFFAEVGIRLLQYITTGKYTPLTEQLQKIPEEVRRLAQMPATYSDSIRLIIPKVLQVVYDLRNKRNIGHTGGDVDENFADATLAVNNCSWVLAELIRIYHTGNIDIAQKLVDSLVEVKLPLIQDFNGFLKVLDPTLSLPNKILVILHHRGKDGATGTDLVKWLGSKNIYKRSHELIKLGYIHKEELDGKYYITYAGEKHLLEIVLPTTISK
jgi:hypothetical protein